MIRRTVLPLSAVALATCLAHSAVRAGDLTFEKRVRAQEAIERVYHAHQVGTSRPFERAVPRASIEEKVRKYLRQTVALESYWKSPVTARMLEREIERMAQQTLMPERLQELFAALGNDGFLVHECLARGVLVDRLARSFFAADERIHAAAQREAERLRYDLLDRRIDPAQDHPRRALVDFGLQEESERESHDRSVRLAPAEFARRRAELPQQAGEVGPLIEERERFVVRVLLDEEPGRVRVASFSVPKESWERWWTAIQDRFDPAHARAVAPVDPVLPAMTTEGVTGEVPCVPDDTWDNGSLDDLPLPRVGHTAVWTGSLMLMWGGWSGGGEYHRTGGRYDPATDSWTLTSIVNAPTGRAGHTAVWTGSSMIVWGGDNVSGTLVNSGGQYDPETDTWTSTSTVDAPAARYGHTAIWTGDSMIVWGGSGHDTGGRYDPMRDTWAPTSTVNAPSGRSNHTAVWTGTTMIVWGGGGQNSGGKYHPETDTWIPTSTVAAPAGRSNHTAVWTGSSMIVWGGPDDTGGRYDPVADTWQPTSTAGTPVIGFAHTAVWTGSRMVVWGGNHFFAGYDSGGQYDPVNDSWTSTSELNAPLGRGHHTAVWTGSSMIVWGGDSGRQNYPYYPHIGGRYDPETDSWTPTSIGGAPSPRFLHTAVWTGNLMVVWGGDGDEAGLESGGRYDPTTDSWTPTSAVGAPLARANHTAVWTGDLMVVWGGGDSLDTGGRYDPLTDSWTPTAMLDVPQGRLDHSAVWSGSSMIVWGGHRWDSGNRHELDTGARYNPEIDSWKQMAVQGAPEARSNHTAVWTGDSMVVWGGRVGDIVENTTNSGGRYDPVADSWVPTSMLGAPSARHRHSLIWTGDSMLLWGGMPMPYSGNALANGARYDPVLDSWVAMSTVNAPPVEGHTAVWTSEQMLVWSAFNAGRYDPVSDTWTSVSAVNAPSLRAAHTAVWTGSWMVVWGGWGWSSYYNHATGGRYALDHSSDNDEDSFSECAGDCNDGDAEIHPGAVELNDGVDNQCPGEPGFGLADEVSGPAGFTDPATFCWTPQAGATQYEVARADAPDFAVGCVSFLTASACFPDTDVPAPGVTFYYLVRAFTPHRGSWGASSAGTERTVPCDAR